MRIARRADPRSVALAALPGLVAVLVLVRVPQALALAAAGVAVLAAGTHLGRRTLVTVGGALAFLAVLLAGYRGAAPLVVGLAVAGTVVAWDAGQHVVGLTAQLGAEADARRSTLVHLAATGTVAAVSLGAVSVVFVLAGAGQPILAVVFLVLGGGLALLALEP